jgi:hypothetical protein
MPLPDLLTSFLAAALASVLVCALKIAFDNIAAASGTAFRLHRPSGPTSPGGPAKSLLKGDAKKKGLKVSFEEDAGARQEQRLGLGVDDNSRMTTTQESREKLAENGILQRPSGGGN